MTMKLKMVKVTAILLVMVVLGGLPAQAGPVTIKLTTDALGLGSTAINYAGNGSAVEDNRPGQLVTSTAPNVGSILYIQSNNIAGQSNLLVTVTARAHLDIVTGLPTDHDVYPGVITLTKDGGDLPKEGLGVRAFGIDTNTGPLDPITGLPTNPNYGKRYEEPLYVTAGNPKGYQMEGSGEVSGGVNGPDWDDYLNRLKNPNDPPNNSPPHVDEDVKFDFNNDLFYVAADSVTVLLTKIGGVSSTVTNSNKQMNLAIELTTTLVGGTPTTTTYDPLIDAPSVFSEPIEGVIEINFGALGFASTDMIESFIIAARDDSADVPRETDEHFLINGFTADITVVPVPGAVLLGMIGLGVAGVKLRKYA